jgi:hypothetical protein
MSYATAAKARGESMTKEDANYLIDKGLATGLLDRDGNLNFVARGTRDEMAEQILAAAKTWGKPMTHAEAEQTADAAIAEIERQRRADVIGARCRDRGRPRRCRLDIFQIHLARGRSRLLLPQ